MMALCPTRGRKGQCAELAKLEPVHLALPQVSPAALPIPIAT